MRKTLLVAVSMLLALTACQKQSELTFEDISGSATIQGTITYDKGHQANEDGYIVGNLPAADITVVAEVNYSEYSTGATGVKQFEARTNNAGEYEFNIPVGQSPISVSVQPRGFQAPYNGNLDVNGEILPTNAFYTGAAKTVTVKNGDLKVLATINMTTEQEDDITSRNLKVELSGEALIEVETSTISFGTEVIERGTEPASCTLQLIVTNTAYPAQKLFYNGITLDKDGKYALPVMLYDKWDLSQTRIQVIAKPYLVSDFIHYFSVIATGNSTNQRIDGIYQQAQASSALSADNTLIGHELPTIVMSFKATNKEVIKGIGQEIDYDDKGELQYISTDPLNLKYD